MANPFFVPGEQRAEKVDQLFTAIASRYDLINDLQSFGLHRYWKWRSLQLAHVQAGERALDACCGTGDLALALARRGAEAVGLDFNQEMLRIAEARKSRIARSGYRTAKIPEVDFVRGDAQALPFDDKSFDVVISAYGLRNLTDWKTGLHEMFRVCRPGGRLLVLEFGKPQNPIWRKLYFSYLRVFVPVLGRVFCGNRAAYSYILESLKHYPGQLGVAATMRELKLEQVRIVNLFGGVMSINYAQKLRG